MDEDILKRGKKCDLQVLNWKFMEENGKWKRAAGARRAACSVRTILTTVVWLSAMAEVGQPAWRVARADAADDDAEAADL